MVTIFDAEGLAVGRLGTAVAKSLLKGENAVVINSEKAIITGDRRNTIAKYAARRAVKNKANPEHAPHWPRRPDMLVRRIIRGMLPFYKKTGREAYKRLNVVMGVPDEFKGKEIAKTEAKTATKSKSKFITILALSNELGWQSPL
jgi:large subunit ribosomal protein L13